MNVSRLVYIHLRPLIHCGSSDYYSHKYGKLSEQQNARLGIWAWRLRTRVLTMDTNYYL